MDTMTTWIDDQREPVRYYEIGKDPSDGTYYYPYLSDGVTYERIPPEEKLGFWFCFFFTIHTSSLGCMLESSPIIGVINLIIWCWFWFRD